VPPADRWRGPRVARGLRDRLLRWRPLAHWTVRCTTGQSGAPPDSPVNYSRTPPNSPKSGLFTGVQPGARDSPVCQTELHFGYTQPSLLHFFLFVFLLLRQNMLVLKTMYLSLETYLVT
jgi:hypothetical protein